MHKEEGRTVESPVEARQGFLDRPGAGGAGGQRVAGVVLYALIYAGFFGA